MTKKLSRQWKRKGQAVRTDITKAKSKEGGSRLVLNKTAVMQSGSNNRKCLLDTITTLLPAKMKELVFSEMAAVMPAEGDTSILTIEHALTTHVLLLKPVSGQCIQADGAPFHLLKEHDCKLIITIKLANLEDKPFPTWLVMARLSPITHRAS